MLGKGLLSAGICSFQGGMLNSWGAAPEGGKGALGVGEAVLVGMQEQQAGATSPDRARSLLPAPHSLPAPPPAVKAE